MYILIALLLLISGSLKIGMQLDKDTAPIIGITCVLCGLIIFGIEYKVF